jgi:2',3'-cyclic-nucleotide 2'-phosphodiesterase (5'-nucleotidase family)
MWGALAVATAACAPHAKSGSTPASSTSGDRTVVLFYLGEVQGTPEPCGCSSDPRGGLSRVVQQVKAARAAAADPASVLFVDAGGLLFDPEHFQPDRVQEERLKADFVLHAEQAANVCGMGLGNEDLLDGEGALRQSRQAANVEPSGDQSASAPAVPPTVPPTVLDAGGVKVGIFGVSDPDSMKAPLIASDPTAAAKAAVKTLQGQGAEVIVALLPLERADAVHLIQAVPGIDFGVLGKDLDDQGLPEAQAAGSGFLLIPAQRDQALGRIDLTLRGPRDPSTPFADAGGPAVAQDKITYLSGREKLVSQQVADLAKVPDADPSYVKTKQDELAQIQSDLARWQSHPLQIPDSGPYFVDALIPVKRGLDCDPDVEKAKVAMDEAIGTLNTTAPDPVVPAPPGTRHYVGMGECESCHRKEVAFWKTTVHAQAFQALVDKGKQFDRDCIVCHTTGWHEPGGASFESYKDFESVQCEVCHGPGSDHIEQTDKAGFDGTIIADPTASADGTPQFSRCLDCHTPEQSDTFAGNEQAYLRDITGPDHGAALHTKLGDEPRAHDIRAAALAKAGTSVGANCQ